MADMAAADLVGVWELSACYERDEHGRMLEGPLGPNPKGRLMYTADGHVAVTMMRTSGTASSSVAMDAVGYAGTWRLAGRQVVHTIEVTSPVTGWAGSDQVRDVEELKPGSLTLAGTDVIDGKRRTAVLEWSRTPPQDH
ncbi:hypothetical protein GCM10010345_43030 [Streptomyces canarius]|uniref:Lipocalin-like domain-containing protein n=2 Tax=Streptomyces TaxID=1883 RepID=A0ABQ3CQQ2_9ACTN|nr:hypothetical protein GCM10010345_43030 [Streptomyces canarius]